MHEYLYNAKNKTLELISEKETEKIQLSDMECRFLEAISNGGTNSWREIADYVYERKGISTRSTHDISNVKSIKMKLLLKVPLKMDQKYGYGIMLLNKIYIR